MKKAVFLMIAFAALVLFSLCAKGATVSEILEQSGAGALYGESDGLTPENLGEKVSFSAVAKFLIDAFKTAFSEESGFFALIAAVTLAAAFFGAIKGGFTAFNTEAVTDTAVMTAVILITSKNFSSMCQTAENAVNSLCAFTKSLIPVVSTLILSSGKPASAAASETFLFVACEVMIFVIETVAVPAVGLYFALATARALSPAFDLSGALAFFRKTVLIVLGAVTACFTVVMSVQSVVAHTGDSAAKNAVKAAALTLLPGVGGQLRQTVDAFFECAEAAKSLTGAFGVATVGYIATAPLVSLLVRYAVMKAAAAIAGMTGTARLSDCLSDVAGGFSMMAAATLGASACAVTTIAVMTAAWS